MKRIFFITVLCLYQLALYAQLNVIAKSHPFDPDDTKMQLLPMKDGRTVVLRRTPKDFSFEVYTKEHKLKDKKPIKIRKELLAGTMFQAFEGNGEIIMMCEMKVDKTPTLYRLVINAGTGEVKAEDKIGELNRKRKNDKAAEFFGVPHPAFFVEKDPYNGSYAVVLCNSFESDRNKRLEIILYDNAHAEVARTYFNSPGNKYKYLNFINMVFAENGQLCVVTEAYNTRASGGDAHEAFMGSLEKGNKLTVFPIPPFKDHDLRSGILKYNPVSRKLVFLSYTSYSRKDNQSHITIIDPLTGKTDLDSNIELNQAYDSNKELFGKKSGMGLSPQNLLINKDGSFLTIFEEVGVITDRFKSGGVASVNTELGKVAMGVFDANGKQLNDYLFPKDHLMYGLALGYFFHSNGGGFNFPKDREGNTFKEYIYLNTANGNYVIMNDLAENEERIRKGKKPVEVKRAKSCDAFYFKLSPGKVVPERQLLFGKQAGDKHHHLPFLSSSVYNAATNEFITFVHEGKNDVRVTWLKPA